MKKTKIDWADSTWNPVTGCLHGCEYCYAQRIAKRFGGNMMPFFVERPILREPVRDGSGKIMPYPFDFLPTFHRYKLDEPKRWTKPRTIFVCSMADMFGEWVPDEWIKQVFEACDAAPQHRYLFLTKNPSRYSNLKAAGIIKPRHNWWFGSSTPDETFSYAMGKNTFVSVEPILRPFAEMYEPPLVDWIIIGAETGNRKNKVIPKKWWIDQYVGHCKAWGIPVFMKESLRGLMGDDFRQEFPWDD